MQAGTTEALLAEIRQLLAEETGHPPETISDDQVREYAELILQEATPIPVHQRFAKQAATTPDAAALLSDLDQWTYQQLNTEADQLACWLVHGEQVPIGTPIGLFLESHPRNVVALLAILKSGASIFAFDQTTTAETLRQSGVSLVLTCTPLADLPCRHLILGSGFPNKNGPLPDDEDNAFLIDSGRGILRFEHALIANRLQWLQEQFNLQPKDHLLPSSQPAEALFEMLWTLTNGACLVFAPKKATILHTTPSRLVRLLNQPRESPLLRLVLCSGEPLAQALVDRFLDTFAAVTLNYLWKAPEVAFAATVQTCRIGVNQAWVPVGQPTEISIFVLDAFHQRVPIGVTGEIFLSGPELLPENGNSECYQDGLLRTGEVGRMVADGSLALSSAVDRSVWLRGMRLDLAQVETALRQDPAIEDCAVIPRFSQDFRWELVAYLVSNSPGANLRIQLPPALQLDRLVPLAALPLTISGHIDEAVLAQMPVLDTDLAQAWEQQLIRQPAVQAGVVLLEPHPEPSPVLHISDLVIPANPPVQPSCAALEIPSPQANSHPPAFCDGGSLPPAPSAPRTLVELLSWAADHYPDHGFIYLTPQEHKQSYPQLLLQARAIVTALRSANISPESPILLVLDNPAELIPAFWGCVLGGYMPLILSVPPSLTEANASLDKLLHTWQFLGEPAILCNDPALSHLMPASKLHHFADLLIYPPAEEWGQPDPDAVALLNLTSGSTGTPKCIQLSHRNLLARARGANLLCKHDESDTLLNWLPFEHIGSISDWHIRGIAAGCRMVYASKELVLAEPLRWLELIDRYRISHSWAPNFAYGLVNQALRQAPHQNWKLGCLKMLLSAGEAVAPQTLAEFCTHLKPYELAETVIHPAFGMAEVGSGITYFVPSASNPLTVHRLDKTALDNDLAQPSSSVHALQLMDLGAPIAGMQLRIVNEHNQLLQERQVGRLQLKGDALFAGYLHNPHASQQVLLPDGWFDSGDLAFLSLGHLVVVARHKETIILNGANYYSHDIERIVETVPGVEVSFTAACGVRPVGAQQEKLAIFFIPSGTTGELLALVQAVRREVVQRLGVEVEYLLPVQKETIAKTAIGKIQRRQLQKRFEAGEFAGVIKQTDLLLGNQNTTGDWFFRKSWRRRVLEKPSQTLNGSVLVFANRLDLWPDISDAVRVEVGERFERLGVRHYRLLPSEEAHYKQLLEQLQAEQIVIAKILHLWTGNHLPLREGTDIEAAQQIGICSLFALVKALSQHHDGLRAVSLRVVSRGVQAVLPDDEVPAWEHGGLPGLLKTINQELPWLDCRHIDLPSAQDEAYHPQIISELLSGRGEREVAYRQNERWVARLQKVDMVAQAKQPLPIQTGGFYLMSGGLGGIGVEVARHLLAHYHLRLLIVGRRSAVDLQGLETLGGEVRYATADVCDLKAITAAVDGARLHWQGVPLAGIFHLAGTSSEQLVVEQTQAELQQILNPKLLGSWVLHQLVRDQPEALFVHFASVLGHFGAATLGAYAAANSAQAAFCAAQRAKGYSHSFCLSWSSWDEIGLSRGNPHKQMLQARGFQSMSSPQALNALLAALCNSEAHLLIGLDSSKAGIRLHLEETDHQLFQLHAYFTARESMAIGFLDVTDIYGQSSPCVATQLEALPRNTAGEIDRAGLVALNQRVVAPQRVPPRNDLELQLARLWQSVLNVPEPGIYDSFFVLGGSSLMLTQLVSRIRETFRVDLPLQVLFGSPTLAGMAKLILTRQLEKQDKDKVARMMQEVKNLSPAQIKALLQARKQP